MSEIITEAVEALTPEAEAALKDAHTFVTGEMDKLRQELPALQQEAVSRAQSLAETMLTRYHAVLAHIEAKLGVEPTAAPAPAAPVEAVPSAPAAVDPTPAPSTTEASSAPSSVTSDASSDTTATPESPAQA